MIQTQVSRSKPVSMNAEKFSTFPCPYWWSASAGLSETCTERKVMIAAIRSRPECAASDKIPKLPVVMPTTIFIAVIAIAASTELPATERFSARMVADEYGIGDSDIAVIITVPDCSRPTDFRELARFTPPGCGHSFVLRF